MKALSIIMKACSLVCASYGGALDKRHLLVILCQEFCFLLK